MLKLFFFHAPKAAGTSIGQSLKALFSESLCAPLIENNRLDHDALAGDYQPFRQFAYYGGHYGKDVFDAVNDGHVVATVFRNPVSRIVSLYNYFRNLNLNEDSGSISAKHFAVFAAKNLTLDQFIQSDDERIELYTRNQHFRQLTGTPWRLECDGSSSEVYTFIDDMIWFNVSEFSEISFQWARSVFGPNLKEFGRLNVTTSATGELISPERISPGTRELILLKNKLDLEIFNYACVRLLAKT